MLGRGSINGGGVDGESCVLFGGRSGGRLGVKLFTLGAAVRSWGQRKGLGVHTEVGVRVRGRGCAPGKGRGSAHAHRAPRGRSRAEVGSRLRAVRRLAGGGGNFRRAALSSSAVRRRSRGAPGPA